MTKLDDLKEQIELDEIEAGETPEAWGDGVFEMPFSTAKTLIETAEIAFEMPEPMDRVLGVCLFCESDQSGIFTPPIPHKPDCPYQRIQTLKKELQ